MIPDRNRNLFHSLLNLRMTKTPNVVDPSSELESRRKLERRIESALEIRVGCTCTALLIVPKD
jgi:hypothetical protein